MTIFSPRLNPEQQEAVLQTEGPLLILAGAGSGKTRVIAHRIAYLVSEGLCEPDRLLAVTFTNKAAEEMRTRVETLLGVDCQRMWISTFHALCARLLRREAPHIGLSRDFVIYDSTDQLTVIKQALRQIGADDSAVQPRLALSRISHAKNRMEGPDVFTANSWNPRDEQIGKLYELYVKALRDANALDFDDLLLKTVELFEKAEAVRERYSQKFRPCHGRRIPGHQPPAVPADPAPGGCTIATCASSATPTSRSTSGAARTCATSSTSNTISPKRASSGSSATTVRRRSFSMRRQRSSRRTAIARTSASIPSGRAARRSCTTAPATISTRRSSSRGPRARRCTTIVENTVAVLYRTNAQSRTLEDALRRAGIAYKIIGGVRFYERKEIKDALAYLKLVLNPHDDVSLRRVINVPARGIGKGVMESLEAVDLPTDADAAAAARRSAAGRHQQFALGPARSCRRPAPARTARRAVARRVSRPDRRADRDGVAGVGVDRAGESARPERLPAGPARGAQRGGRRPDREPGGARLRGARIRDAESRTVAGGFRRSAVAALRRRRRSRSSRRPRADDDDAQREGPRVPGRRRSPGSKKDSFRIHDRPTTRPSSKRSAGSATSASRARSGDWC